MELLIIAAPTVAFLAWFYYYFIHASPAEKKEEADWQAYWERQRAATRKHESKPAICLNCRHYNQASRACHRMPQPTRKPADHWCGEFNRITFVFKEEA